MFVDEHIQGDDEGQQQTSEEPVRTQTGPRQGAPGSDRDDEYGGDQQSTCQHGPVSEAGGLGESMLDTEADRHGDQLEIEDECLHLCVKLHVEGPNILPQGARQETIHGDDEHIGSRQHSVRHCVLHNSFQVAPPCGF